jgi:hypothetical protein
VPTPDPTPLWVFTLVRQEVEYQDLPEPTYPADPPPPPKITYRDQGRIALPHAQIQSAGEFDAETFRVNHWHVRGSWREFLASFAGDVTRIYHFPPPPSDARPDAYVAEDLPTGPPEPDNKELTDVP